MQRNTKRQNFPHFLSRETGMTFTWTCTVRGKNARGSEICHYVPKDKNKEVAIS